MTKNRGRSPANMPNPQIIREQTVNWEGPIPPPQAIEAYERLVPGSAQIMWNNFDEQSQHRRELEKKVVVASEDRANRGQYIAAVLIVLAIVAGVVIALAANAYVGGAVVLGSIVSGAAIYIAGGKAQMQDPSQEETQS